MWKDIGLQLCAGYLNLCCS